MPQWTSSMVIAAGHCIAYISCNLNVAIVLVMTDRDYSTKLIVLNYLLVPKVQKSILLFVFEYRIFC